jgi:peptidoglycan/LPS O-acetylase OafA/YrhL
MPLGHFWSLSVEEQFYLIWPFVILAVKNMRRIGQVAYLILITCILCRFSSWLSLGNGYTNFAFQYMTRLDGLCIGSLIAIWRFNGSYAQTKKKIIRLALGVFGFYAALIILTKIVPGHLSHFPFLGYTVIAVIFGAIVFAAIEKRNFLSKLLLQNKVITYIGKISYGLYVFHWPILTLFKIYLLNKMTNSGYSPYTGYVMVSLMALAVAVIVSIASYHLFEKKMLALKDIMTEEGFFARAGKKLVSLFRAAFRQRGF